MARLADLLTEKEGGIVIDPLKYLYKDTRPPAETVCIEIGGKKIGSMGNIVTIQGKPKSRKTVFITGLIASFLSGSPVLGMDCILPENAKIAWIDTEQSKYDLYRCVSYVKKEFEAKVLPPCISVFQNRPLGPAENRAFLKELTTNFTEFKIIFLDGLLDFVSDMNNIEECTGLFKSCKK